MRILVIRNRLAWSCSSHFFCGALTASGWMRAYGPDHETALSRLLPQLDFGRLAYLLDLGKHRISDLANLER
jgi:hypothetical protein